MTNRRSFLKTAGIGMTIPSVLSLGRNSLESNFINKNDISLNLGVASYSFRNFTLEQTLEMTERAGLDRITFKSMHLGLNSSKQEIEHALMLCKSKGITLYGAGVITMKTKEDVDQAFDYAKNAKLEMIIGVPYPDVLEYTEQQVKQYNIKLAIHNHGPGDDLYTSGPKAYDIIKKMDKRMGLCLDIGHVKRINRDPVQDFKYCFDRIFDVHLKDVTAPTADGTNCIIGKGVIDMPHFLKSIIKLKYKGTCAFEYEAEENDPLPGLMACVGYVRGVLATL